MAFVMDNDFAARVCGMLPAKPLRPTDRDMLQAVADAYGVSPKQAHAWLYTVDFDGLSDELIDEERCAA